jgi:hypothetical protein
MPDSTEVRETSSALGNARSRDVIYKSYTYYMPTSRVMQPERETSVPRERAKERARERDREMCAARPGNKAGKGERRGHRREER